MTELATALSPSGKGKTSRRPDDARQQRVAADAHALARFCGILAAFLATVLASWPLLFSLQLWAFRDRGSMLNVQYLLDQHLRLGVDAYYSYGLLPVWIQRHLLFSIFGRGYGAMIGFDLFALALMAAFWTRLLGHLPREKAWTWAVILMSPILVLVNPVFPYMLVQLSMIFALLFVLEKRLDLALATAAVGCFSVPSLPLVLFAMLACAIIADWWLTQPRSVGKLIRQLVPGLAVYAFLLLLLMCAYGTHSALITAFPILGSRFYKAVGFGFATTLMAFLHPAGHTLRYYAAYYIVTPATWWLLSTLAIFFFGAVALVRMIRDASVDARYLFVVLCAVLQGVLAFVAYGVPDQHVLYDLILAAGVLVGISCVPPQRLRSKLLIAFVAIGVLSMLDQARLTLDAWRNTRRFPQMANLYANPGWANEWTKIVDISETHHLLLLSYGTGVRHYFPTVRTADVWFLRIGQLFPADRARVLAEMEQADVIVEDVDNPTSAIDRDQDIQNKLGSMCLTNVTSHFQIWRRRPPAGAACLVNPRPAL